MTKVPPPRPLPVIGVTPVQALSMVRIAQDAGLTAATATWNESPRARAFIGTGYAWMDDPEDVLFAVVDQAKASALDEYRAAA
jgi:hypothetical protein